MTGRQVAAAPLQVAAAPLIRLSPQNTAHQNRFQNGNQHGFGFGNQMTSYDQTVQVGTETVTTVAPT